MAQDDYPIDVTVGANFERRTTEPDFRLGETRRGTKNRIWIYGQASGSVPIGSCTVNGTTFLITAAAGSYTADVALANGEYGWVRQTAGVTT